MNRALLPWVALCAALSLGCVRTVQVELEPGLAKLEDDLPALKLTGVRVAVMAPEASVVVRPSGSASDAAPPPADAPVQNAPPGAAPPAPLPTYPHTTVAFTDRYKESYPSMAHLVAAVPAALRELGADPVVVTSADEARIQNAQVVLELLDPEVEGFRRATGNGVSLEGTVYDLHVTIAARLSRVEGGPLGQVSGYGESTTNFRFDDPYLEQAVVGALAVVTMVIITTASTVPVVAAVWLRRNEREPLGAPRGRNGLCDESSFSSLPATPGASRPALCGKASWLMMQVGAAAGVTAVAGLSLGLSSTVGGWLFTGATNAIKSFAAERQWRGMLKASHDRAARSLALKTGQALQQAGLAPTTDKGGRP